MLCGGCPSSVRWNRSPASALSTLLALLTALAFGGCDSGKSHGSSDSSLLVPWSSVGNIWLGEPRARVEQDYGSEGHGFHVIQRYGSKSDEAVQGYYRLHGSQFVVTFYGDRVGQIGFTTPYYRTEDGFGVGSRIPLGPCHKPASRATRSCEHRWRGFVYNAWSHDEPCHCWTKVGRGRKSLPATVEQFLRPWFIIYVDHGRVTGFNFDLKYVD
jgi:hypothetical protein